MPHRPSACTPPNCAPAPWSYGYNPYVLQQPGLPDREIPAFEVFDANGNRVLLTDEDSDAGVQEANARLAAAAPDLLAACRMVVERWQRGDLAAAARACDAAVAKASAA